MSLTSFTPTPAFIGPVEIVLLMLVVIVLVFGSRAPEVAERVGESFGQFQKSKQKVEEEVEGVSEDLDQVRTEVENIKEETGIDEDIQHIQEDIEGVRKPIESTGTNQQRRSVEEVTAENTDETEERDVETEFES